MTGAAPRTFLDGVHTVYAVGIGLAVVAGLLALLLRDSSSDPESKDLAEQAERHA